jgi:hypothetical protein
MIFRRMQEDIEIIQNSKKERADFNLNITTVIAIAHTGQLNNLHMFLLLFTWSALVIVVSF